MLEQLHDLGDAWRAQVVAQHHGVRYLLVVAFRIDQAELVPAFGQPFEKAYRQGGFSASRRSGHEDAATIRLYADLAAVLTAEEDFVSGQGLLELAQVVLHELVDELDDARAVI